MQNNIQRGIAMPTIIALVALVLVVGGIVFSVNRSQNTDDKMAQEKTMNQKSKNALMEKKENELMKKPSDAAALGGKDDGVMMKKEETSTLDTGKTMMQYAGTVLAGTRAPLLDFNKSDYDAAIKSDKLIVLYFYANWCPACKAEFPVMQKAFNALNTDKSIGFRVNYNDDQTDADEKSLARQFGVAYQHTKVFVKNGERMLKSPESWDEKRYDMEINNALAQ